MGRAESGGVGGPERLAEWHFAGVACPAPGADNHGMRRTTKSSLALLLLPLAGCVAVAAGAIAAAAVYGVIKYENNEAVRYYEASYKDTYAATLKVMRSEGYPVQEGLEPDADGDQKVEIDNAYAKVKREGEKSTAVRIRIGTFETEEHKSKAERILNGIAKELGVK